MENLIYTKFKNINLDDPFFDSLKEDYKEFTDWFNKKRIMMMGLLSFLILKDY
ncbi:hypothetical protein [Mannheimia pernigra]|uniref:hypothetical protein n=1 Tax=Mannheimia pernigra TaxID=111844 RepID=UPI00192DFB08|nr:hypothetical protein [Mannheimia pernigra]